MYSNKYKAVPGSSFLLTNTLKKYLKKGCKFKTTKYPNNWQFKTNDNKKSKERKRGGERERTVCVCACVCACACMCVCVCVCVCACVCMCVCMCVCVHACVCVCKWERERVYALLWEGTMHLHIQEIIPSAISLQQIHKCKCFLFSQAWPEINGAFCTCLLNHKSSTLLHVSLEEESWIINIRSKKQKLYIQQEQQPTLEGCFKHMYMHKYVRICHTMCISCTCMYIIRVSEQSTLTFQIHTSPRNSAQNVRAIEI